MIRMSLQSPKAASASDSGLTQNCAPTCFCSRYIRRFFKTQVFPPQKGRLWEKSWRSRSSSLTETSTGSTNVSIMACCLDSGMFHITSTMFYRLGCRKRRLWGVSVVYLEPQTWTSSSFPCANKLFWPNSQIVSVNWPPAAPLTLLGYMFYHIITVSL